MSTAGVTVAMIAARARNGVIGRDGGLPWRLPSDLAWFKRATMGKPIVMGRKQWRSLPRALPGRPNIVLSTDPGFQADGAETFTSLTPALQRARAHAEALGVDEIMIIGGAVVYAAAAPYAGRLYLTEIDADVDGDVVFPPFHEADWRELAREARPAGPNDDFPYVIRTLERVAAPVRF